MENISNSFVSRIKSLITFSKNGLRILAKKVVEVQVDSASEISHEEKTRPVINLNLYKKAVRTIPFVYELIFISVMDYTYPNRI